MSDNPVVGIAIPSPLVYGGMDAQFNPGVLDPDQPDKRSAKVRLLLMDDGSVGWAL